MDGKTRELLGKVLDRAEHLGIERHYAAGTDEFFKLHEGLRSGIDSLIFACADLQKHLRETLVGV